MPLYDLIKLKITPSDPVTPSDEVAIYSKESDSYNELFFRRESAGDIIQITKQGGENNLNIDLSTYMQLPGDTTDGDIIYGLGGIWVPRHSGEYGQVLTIDSTGMPDWMDYPGPPIEDNILTNSAMYYWRSGGSSPPSFMVSDGSSTIARNNSTTKISNSLGQRLDLTNPGGSEAWVGWKVDENGFTDGNYISLATTLSGTPRLSAGVWIYCTTASRVRTRLYGGTGDSDYYSDFHQGSGWEWIEIKNKDFSTATTIQFTIRIESGSAITIGIETPVVGIGGSAPSWIAYTYQRNRTYSYSTTVGPFSSGNNDWSISPGFHVSYATGTVEYSQHCSNPWAIPGPTCTSSTGQLTKATISQSSSCSGSYLATNDAQPMQLLSWNTAGWSVRQVWGGSCLGGITADITWGFEERSLS